jgi:glycosyltransferase involved in cell wall biosynthesis|tara:strand:- start:496 stop:1194 length:699 start_codon:yes stop_codon:yes gene_type:complete
MTKLTFIIPVYNEIKTIEKLIKKILKLNIKKQIIIIDDGSNDGTERILRKYKNLLDKLIIHKKNLGKGAAIKSGQKHVNGKYVAIQDADLEYDPNDLKKIINEMDKKNLKVMYGSRVLNKNTFQNTQNFTHILRIWGNIFLTIISNFFNSQKLTDAHTCYKVFNSRIFKKIKLKEKGFSFCPEITTKISLMNIDIEEFPINYNGRTYNQGKKITAFDGLDAIYVLLKYRYFK